MTHFTDQEIVDLIDGALPPERRAHLDECGRCRGDVEQFQRTMALAKEVEVPEPSPLFWDHFSARVRAGIEQTVEETRLPWVSRNARVWKWAVPIAAGLLIAVGVWRFASDPASGTLPVSPARAAPEVTAVSAADDLLSSPDADEAWALVRSIADDVEWTDDVAAGLGVSPGWAERAAADLNRTEIDELVRLLAAEAKHPGAS